MFNDNDLKYIYDGLITACATYEYDLANVEMDDDEKERLVEVNRETSRIVEELYDYLVNNI